ncbi:Hsp20/alpha crystallin family protein [Methylobacterium nodulans]|uniref:Heat shock protein Hsp20 n=1 Tax=Methylobacterium nodulans (strain LMG 21967 / CNCM I-2342 / ORS 2060) TaxID=460265 RepID=B8IH28_METNO|nr:Hsp20/alpha crystallin family protein [Methylobacterium nodulans]ACL59720.1 heat shock protein Hsp20 [Methylobacterium nodulans ORS 2060]
MARNPLTPFRSGSLLGGGDPFLSLHREMNRLFDDVFRDVGLPASGGQATGGGHFINAHMNVSETDKEIRITAELPGVTDKDIDVSLDDDVLTIRGEKRFEQSKGGEKENFHFVERSYGTFQRSLRLPFPVDAEQVKASFENGVLMITLPKTAQQERSRRIQVQSAGGSQSSGGAGGQGSDQVSQGMSEAGQGQAPQGGQSGAGA